MKKIMKFLVSATFIVLASSSILSVAAPVTAAASDSCSSGFLGFPAWYRGLTDGSCNIESPEAAGGIQKFITVIAFNCVEIALVAAAYVTVGFIIFGGYSLMVSGGDPQGVARGRKIITDAIIGLAIVLAAVAIVQFLSSSIIGG